MTYTKQNFVNGQVLTAAKLNAMDDALKEKADIPVMAGTGKYSVIEGAIYEDDPFIGQMFDFPNVASGRYAHAEGAQTTASGFDSHAEGGGTIASGQDSHAEGMKTTASGDKSHAEGSFTNATGGISHAEGWQTVSSGDMSHAEGAGTIANHKAQHALGRYNVADPSSAQAYNYGDYVEIVGNGTSDSARSNARTLDWSGNEALAGSLTLGMGTANPVTITAAQLAQLLALLS